MISDYLTTDPEEIKRRNLTAVVIIAIVAIALAGLIKTLWDLSHVHSIKANTAIVQALTQSNRASGYTSYEFAYPRSNDDVSATLLLEVNNIKAEKPELTGVGILSFNETTGKLVHVSLPLDMWVPDEHNTSYELKNLFAERGNAEEAGARCIVRISAATHIKFTHAIVMAQGVWGKIVKCSESERPWSLSIGETLNRSICDFDFDDMAAFIERCHTYGLSGVTVQEMQGTPFNGAHGKVWNWVEPDPLNLTLGFLKAE